MVYGGDWMRTYDRHVADVLAAGKRVLVYAGVEDFMCNYMGNQAWTDRFRWDGHAAFRRARMVDWAPRLEATAQDGGSGGGQKLRRRRAVPAEAVERGQYKSAEGLTFLTIDDAGHLAPMDQPAATLAMVRCVVLCGWKEWVGLVAVSMLWLTRSCHAQAIHTAGWRGLRADGGSAVGGGGRGGRCTGDDGVESGVCMCMCMYSSASEWMVRMKTLKGIEPWCSNAK